MNHFILILFFTILAGCEANKESLPGSYKLERPAEEKTLFEKQLRIWKQNITLDKRSMEFEVADMKKPEDKYSGSLRVVSATVKEKTKLVFQLSFGEIDFTYSRPYPKDLKSLQEFNFRYEGFKLEGLFRCQDPDCNTIQLSMIANNISVLNDNSLKLHTVMWEMTQNEGSFIIQKIGVLNYKPEINSALLADPNYIFSLPADSPDIKWQSY